MVKRIESSTIKIFRLLTFWARGQLIEVPWEKIQGIDAIPPSVEEVLGKMQELERSDFKGLQIVVVFGKIFSGYGR